MKDLDYRSLPHTADDGFEVHAPSLERLYIHAALALTDIRVPLKCIEEKLRRSVKVESFDTDTLMVRWLNEVLYLFDVERFLPHRIFFEKFDGNCLEATLIGESYDPSRHGSISEIKAVTYHQLELGSERDSGYFAKIFIDL